MNPNNKWNNPREMARAQVLPDGFSPWLALCPCVPECSLTALSVTWEACCVYPEKLGGFLPQRNIETKSWESVAKFYLQSEQEKKEREKLVGSILRETHFQWDLGVFKSSLTPPCLGGTLWRRRSPLVVSEPMRKWLGNCCAAHLKAWPGVPT